MYILLNWQCPKAVFDTKEKLYSYAKAYSKRYDNENTCKAHWSIQKIEVNPDVLDFDKSIDIKSYAEYTTQYFDVLDD